MFKEKLPDVVLEFMPVDNANSDIGEKEFNYDTNQLLVDISSDNTVEYVRSQMEKISIGSERFQIGRPRFNKPPISHTPHTDPDILIDRFSRMMVNPERPRAIHTRPSRRETGVVIRKPNKSTCTVQKLDQKQPIHPFRKRRLLRLIRQIDNAIAESDTFTMRILIESNMTIEEFETVYTEYMNEGVFWRPCETEDYYLYEMMMDMGMKPETNDLLDLISFCNHYKYNAHYDMMNSVLLSKRCDVNALCQTKAVGQFKGVNALHYACICMRPLMVKMLLENGANPNAKTESGETPLQLVCENKHAIKYGHIEFIKFYIDDCDTDPLFQDILAVFPERPSKRKLMEIAYERLKTDLIDILKTYGAQMF
jgi:hypothetical protein